MITSECGPVEIHRGTEIIDVLNHDVIAADAETVYEELGKECVGGTLDFDTTIFEKRYYLDNISADPTSKTDIVLEIYDHHVGTIQRLPFSIKSFMGSPPTLLNSSGSTNFIYRVRGNLSESDIDRINSMITPTDKVDVIGRVKEIYGAGCKLEFEKLQNNTFDGNLRVVDSALPEILGQMLLSRYLIGTSSVSELTKYLSKINPLKYQGPHEFYKVKICRLLMASFTGMKANEVWNGYDEVHGGYIVVRADGKVVCYHLSNRNKFEEYLFNRTYLETYGARKSKFAFIEHDKMGLIFKLNLDIRMKESSVKHDDSDFVTNMSGQTKLSDYQIKSLQKRCRF